MAVKNNTNPRKARKAFYNEANQVDHFSVFDRLHAYVYLRWPYLYIGIAKGNHPLSKVLAPLWRAVERLLPERNANDPERVTFADTYHGKVVPTAAAARLVTIQENLRIDDLEQVIPYKKARSIIMQDPDHIVVIQCPCRSVKENPCLPLDVCLIIGEPFASFAAAHHPKRSRWITPAKAVEILEAERGRGHVSHAFFKDAMLGRFYAICNCCSCCCGAMQAHHNGSPMLASSGYLAQVDEDACIACGTCVEFCQFAAVSIEIDHAVVDFDSCMGCGVCEAHCEQGAIRLVLDQRKGIPLEIEQLGV
jgi:Pyruvate/2-oxoacid:ferredoxin oxidoreductase delta subunit